MGQLNYGASPGRTEGKSMIAGNSSKRLKVETQAQQKGAIAGQFRSEIQRVDSVILIGEVQEADTHFGLQARESVTRGHIELPEIVPGEVGRVTLVRLAGPD